MRYGLSRSILCFIGSRTEADERLKSVPSDATFFLTQRCEIVSYIPANLFLNSTLGKASMLSPDWPFSEVAFIQTLPRICLVMISFFLDKLRKKEFVETAISADRVSKET